MNHEFDWLAFTMRWVPCAVLVLGTYDPYGMSYYQWITTDGGYTSLKVLAGVTLLILHVVVIVATARSLGPIGVGLTTALFGSAAWFLVDGGILDIESPKMFELTVLLIVATVYGIGTSWSHIRNRLSGQVHSVDVTALSPI